MGAEAVSALYKMTILKVAQGTAGAQPLPGTLAQLVDALSRELEISVDDFPVASKVPTTKAKSGWRWTAVGYLQNRYSYLRARHGAAILTRKQFMEWACRDPGFRALHRAYVDSVPASAGCGLSPGLRPVVVRINDDAAWVESNMRWVTFSERKRAESDLMSGRYKERSSGAEPGTKRYQRKLDPKRPRAAL
jgi:hypothetical protein